MIAALALLFANQANAAEMVIHNASELIQFSNNVNNRGTSYYSSTTVFLGADIDFSDVTDTFDPIGESSYYYFKGVFDGQGHTISNLIIETSKQYAGLFGYSRGTTIKNVVLDDSCNIESTYYGNAYVGGIVGYAQAYNLDINIENCLNMAGVSYNQYISSSYSSYLGGIAGYASTSSYELTIINCANYGTVVRSSQYYEIYIGGIVGYLYDSYSYYYSSVINCLNYGSVSVTGSYYSSSSSDLYIGGIIGYSQADEISNCLSVGEVSVTYSTPSSSYIGGIAGYIYGSSSSSIDHCIWSESTGVEDGFGNTFSSPVPTDCYMPVELNETTIEELNDHAEYLESPSRWALTNQGKEVYLTVSGRKTIHMPFSVVLLPANFNNTIGSYGGWYTDADCKNSLDKATITQPNIYAKWEYRGYTITFVFTDEQVHTETKHYDELIEYPTPPAREHYVFMGWSKEVERMPAEDVTIYAIWEAEKFYVTFDMNYNAEPIVEAFTYGQEIDYPDVSRTGYEFVEWDKNIIKMPAENITITARWRIIYYTATFINGDKNETKTYFYNNSIKFPTPAEKEGHTFSWWYPRTKRMPPHNETFRAVYRTNVYTAFFVYGYEDMEDDEVAVYYNDTVPYPTPTRPGCEFVEWDNDITTMPAHNVTFTAKWKVLEYVLTFYEEDEKTVIESRKLHYDDAIIYPEVTTKGTRLFDGWTRSISKMPARDVNITVKRKDVPTSQVKVKVQGDLSEEALREQLGDFTEMGFAIKDFKSGSGATTATIIFDDKVIAEMFVSKVVDTMGSGSKAAIQCEYHYYEGYDDKSRREPYHYASDAAALVASVAALFIFAF